VSGAKKGVVLAPARTDPEWLVVQIGDVEVPMLARPFNVVLDEEARQRLEKESRATSSITELLQIMAPTAAAALRSVDAVTLESALHVWLAIQIGRVVVEDWDHMLDPDGQQLPFSADRFDLACMTVPKFAQGFYEAWTRPRTMVAAAGNA